MSDKTLRVLLEQLEAAKAQIIKQRCVEGMRSRAGEGGEGTKFYLRHRATTNETAAAVAATGSR